MDETRAHEPPSGDVDEQPTPRVTLPARVPLQRARPVQGNIPARRADRDRLARAARARVDALGLTPPLSMDELREHALAMLHELGLADGWVDYTAVLLNNAAWRDALAGVPFERRLLLLPKCLRVAARCPAPFDALGLLCKECGLCSLQDLTVEAERLGYAVLVAEGSAVVRRLVETGQVDAVIGVACLNVLERSFPHLEAGAVPGLAIPLLQDDCVDTTVDMDQVWEVIHLTSEDRSYRLDLDALRDEVRRWFEPEALDAVLGPVQGPADRLARRALVGGKRWRPFLAVCAWLALRADAGEEDPRPSDDLRRLAVALECFHKASLVHDDIEDDDLLRDGEPTLQATHSVPEALNAGDLLVGEGYRLLAGMEAPPEVVRAVLREAAAGHATLCRGQGAELAERSRADVPSSVAVLDVFRQKTAPAFGVALATGALLAGADDEVLSVLGAYAEAVGIAYQILDDLDDLATPGPEALARGSLLVAIAAKRDGDPERLAAAWRGELPLDADLADLLVRTGAADKARELRKAYEEQAVRALRLLQQPTLKGLLRRVVARVFPQDLVEGACDDLAARHAADGAARAEGARTGG